MPRHRTVTVLIEDGQQQQPTVVELYWPPDLVEGSEHLEVSVTGMKFGSLLEAE